MLSLGKKVKYKGRKYRIIHIYNSGFLEIKDLKQNSYTVELVKRSEIELVGGTE